MQSDDPPFLAVGTEVSAKFKGAFCEAKVKRISKSVKCKIQLRTPPYGTIFADHTEIRGILEVNQQVEIMQGKAIYKGVIQNIKDNSVYIVVFNDGDERQLRRTQLCIKGAKHFSADVNLDAMPLHKPESFINPVLADDRRCIQKRRKLKRSQQRQQQQQQQQQQQLAARITEEKRDARDFDDVDDRTSSENESVQETSSCSTTFSETSTNTTETIMDSMTVATAEATRRKLRARPQMSKSVTSRRLPSGQGGLTSFYKRNKSVRNLKNGNHEVDEDDVGRDGVLNNSKIHRVFGGPQKPSVSRMIADKILTKSIARTRKKRCAAAAAINAMKRIKESVNGGDKLRAVGLVGEGSGIDIGDNDEDDFEDRALVNGGDSDDFDGVSHADDDEEGDDGGDNDDDDGDDDSGSDYASDIDKGKGKTFARQKHCSSDDNDDDKSQRSNKMMALTTTSSTGRRNERKRQGMRDKMMEPMVKKRQKHVDDAKKLYKVGSVVAVFEDSAHKGKWTPAVVVSEMAFKSSAKNFMNPDKNDVLLRSFKDAKYISCSTNRLSSPGTSVLKLPEVLSKAAFDRAVAFAEKEVLPMGWEKIQIYGEDVRSKENEQCSPLIEHSRKQRSEITGRIKQEKEKMKASAGSSSLSESSTDEEYGEERDQFTAQLYKFHEERGTPINRAPILGGKDIDMFRLYNVVQRFGGKKRVTENNQWKYVLRKMHLEGCPGATSVTVKNAYSRYLDHFNSFYRSLGMSSWLSTSTPSTSSRSERPSRLLDRQNIQLQRKKLALIAAKKKERGQKENATKAKIIKRWEKDDSAVRLKKEKLKKDERNMTKCETGEDDDKSKTAIFTSSQCPASLPSLSPSSKSKMKTKDEVEQEKESVSDSATYENVKDKGILKDEKESTNRGRPRGSRKKEPEKEKTSRDEQQNGLKTAEIDKRFKAYKSSKLEKKPLHEDCIIKQKSPSTVSTLSNVDQAVSGSEDEARTRQFRKLSTTTTDQKESLKSKREGSVIGKESETVPRREKIKEGIVPWLKCRPATVLTNFYMGQNVKAYHHGQWYDARVITLGKGSHSNVLSSMMDFEARCKAINESVECNEKERKEALTTASARLNDRLEGILREMTCCVHYLGWNSRYDEWVELIKIKVHEKDQKLSEEQFLSVASDKLSPPTLEAAVAWRSSVDPNKLFAEEVNCSGMRPRRLSHTHDYVARPESRPRSSTFLEKKVRKHRALQAPPYALSTLKIPSNSAHESVDRPPSANLTIEFNAEIVLNRSPQEAAVLEATPQLSLSNAAVSSTVFAADINKEFDVSTVFSIINRRRTCSENYPLTRRSLQPQDTLKKSSSVVSGNADVNSKTLASMSIERLKLSDRWLLPIEESRTNQVDNKEIKFKVVAESSEVTTGKGKPSCTCEMIREVTEEAKQGVQHQGERKSNNLAGLAILVKNTEFESKDDPESLRKEISTFSQISPAEDSSEKMTSSCRDSISMESEAAAEDIASKECDEDGWHPPLSLALKQRGRGIRRKRLGRNTSSVVVERRGGGRGGFKRTNIEEQSKESEESSTTDDESLYNVRDSWHALKVRMQQKMEVEGALANAERELGLDPIDCNLSGEALIGKLQERMQDLRDLYHSIRAEQAHLDRRWRKTLEKRKHREKEHRKKEESSLQSPVDGNIQ